METEKQLNDKILLLTESINKNYPELSKYLEEMPITIPNESTPEINCKILKEYYLSLSIILNRYIAERDSASINNIKIK